MSAGLAVTRAAWSGGDGPRASPRWAGQPAAECGGSGRRGQASGEPGPSPVSLRPQIPAPGPAPFPACTGGQTRGPSPGQPGLQTWHRLPTLPRPPAPVGCSVCAWGPRECPAPHRPAGPVTPDPLQPALQDCLLPKWQDLTSKSSCHSSLFGRQL